MLGMLLICNPIALFCSEWSLVVIIPYPTSFVPSSFASKMSLSCWGWAGTHLSFPAELACPQLNTFQAYIQGLWPYPPPLCGGHNSCSSACTTLFSPFPAAAGRAPMEVWRCRDKELLPGPSVQLAGSSPSLSLSHHELRRCLLLDHFQFSERAAKLQQSCSHTARWCLQRLVPRVTPSLLLAWLSLSHWGVFLVEGLSHTQENAWAVVCTHETVRGDDFQAKFIACLNPNFWALKPYFWYADAHWLPIDFT